MVELKVEAMEEESLEDESYIKQVSDTDWGYFELVFNKENLPEEVKEKFGKDGLQKHLREGLTKKGVQVKRVRSGMYNEKDVLFVRIDHSIRPTFPELIKSLNRAYWDSFDTTYFEANPGGDYWGVTDGSKVTEEGRCLVLIQRKMPEEVQEKFKTENLEEYVKKVLKDKKVSVVNVNRVDKNSIQIMYINVIHSDDKTFPKLVEDLNVDLWDCLVSPKREKPVQCVLCKIVLGEIEKVNVQSHLKGKTHQKMLKKKDDIGVLFDCEVCGIKSFNGREEYNKHMNGSKHLKNTNMVLEKECQVCSFKTTKEMSLNDHLDTDEHKKQAGFPDAKSFGIQINLKLWRCELCSVSSNTEASNKGHLNGGKHRKFLELFEKTGHVPGGVKAEVVTETSEKVAFLCKPCNVAAGSEAIFKRHMEGKKHKHKMTLENNEVASDVKITVLNEGQFDNQLAITCDLCDVTVKSKITFKLHLKGAKHMKNKANKEGVEYVKIPQTPKIKKEGVVPKEKLKDERKCNACNVTAVSDVAFKAHMEGAKHAKKILNLENHKMKKQMEIENNANSNNIEVKMDSEEPKEKFSCLICNIQTNDDAAMQKHLMGGKHKRKLERGGDTVESQAEYEKTKGQVFCDVCSIYCNDDAMMKRHKLGSKHLKKTGVYLGKRKMLEGGGNTGPEKKFCPYPMGSIPNTLHDPIPNTLLPIPILGSPMMYVQH